MSWYDPIAGTGLTGYGPDPIMASINNQMANQQQQMAGWNSFNPWANTPGGFGAQTAHYQQAAANNYGAINSAQTDRLRALYPSAFSGGGIGSDAARAPNQPAIQPQYPGPASSGWTHNEGAQVPQQPAAWPMGQFRPQTYGWDHNEGAGGGGQVDRLRALYPNAFSAGGAGSAGDVFSRDAPKSGIVSGTYDPFGGGGGYPNSHFQTQLPQNWQKTFNNMINGNPENPYTLGTPDWYPQQRTGPQSSLGGRDALATAIANNTNWYGGANVSS